MPEKKDNYPPGTQGGQEGRTNVPTQESIDLLTRLLQAFNQRAIVTTTTSPEVERDVAFVVAAFRAIHETLALRPSPIRVASLDTTTGPIAGGTSVVITGEGLLPGSSVRFGNNAATEVTHVSISQMRAVTPAAGSAGPVDVVVLTVAGPARLHNGFTYQGSGQVS